MANRKFTFGSDLRFVCKVNETSDVEDGFGDVVKDEEAESQSRKVHSVGGSDSDQVDGGVRDAGGHILAFHLLEVEFRVRVEPVGDLDDKEEFEHERHGHVRVIAPQGRDVEEETLSEDDVAAPENGSQVEDEQLA